MKNTSMMAGVSATLLWALFPAFCKLAMQHTDVYSFYLLRYAVAVGVFAYLTPGVIRKWTYMPLRARCAIFALASIHNATQALCLQDVPVSWYALFFACSPLLTYFIMPQHKNAYTYGCLGLAIIGTLIFLQPSELAHVPHALSLAFLFLSVISWAFLTKVMADFHKVYQDQEISYILSASNLVTACVLFAVLQEGPVIRGSWEQGLFWIALIGISSPIAAFLFSMSLRHVPSFGIAAQYLELIFGVLVGYVFFAEIPTLNQYAGSFLIVMALLATTWKTIQERRQNAAP